MLLIIVISLLLLEEIPIYNTTIGHFLYEREPYLLGGIPFAPSNSGTNPSVACCLDNFDRAENNDNTEYFSYPSSWMLIKITSPTGDLIYFNYSNIVTSYLYLADRSFSSSAPDLAEDKLFFTNGSSVPAFTSPVQPVPDNLRSIYILPSKQVFSITKSTIELKTKKLISITTSENNGVNFAYTTQREDLLGDTRLDNIQIVNSDFKFVKKVNFNYDIITTPITQSPDEQFKFFYHVSRYWYDQSVPQNYLGMNSNYVTGQFFPYTEEVRTWKPSTTDEYRRRGICFNIFKYKKKQTELQHLLMDLIIIIVLNCHSGQRLQQDYFGFATSNPSKHPFLGYQNNALRLSYIYPNPYNPSTSKVAPVKSSSDGIQQMGLLTQFYISKL